MSEINGDPAEKFDPSRPAFQGHSRSLERTTRIDRLPMTSY